MFDAIVTYLGASLLGGTLLFAATLLVTRLPAVKRRPSLVFAMWLVVLVRFVVPAFIGAGFSLESLARGALSETFILDVGATATDVSVVAAHASISSIGVLDVLAGSWLVIVAGLIASTIVGAWRTSARLRALPDAPATVLAIASEVSTSIGLRRAPRVVLGERGPLAFGIARPIIAIPRRLVGDPSLPSILAHELGHVRRRDGLWALVSRLGVALFFFWPPIWWVRSRLLLAREQACDRIAIDAARTAAREYASTLLAVGATGSRVAHAVTMAGRRSQLAARLDAILAGPSRRSRLRLGAAGVALLAMQIAVGMPGADAETRERVGALDCVVTPGLGARILEGHPDADRDGDGQLSRAEICAHQRRMQKTDVVSSEDAMMSLLVEPASSDELASICIEEPRCGEPLPPAFESESRY